MKEIIQEAYDLILPEKHVQERIWSRIETQTDFAPAQRTGRRLLILALAAAALACGGFAAWQGWHLPQPQTYEPDEEMGVYHVQTETVYTPEEIPVESEGADKVTDAYFLTEAVRVLEAVGLEDVDTNAMRLVRQEHLAYGREEVEVFFENDQLRTSVKFHGTLGHLLSLSSIDWLEEGKKTDRDPGELAQEYYEKLPVRQGYVRMEEPERYDAQYWSYSFCRQVQPGLFSYYEMVRISVNPVSGWLVGCNVFYFPLLDDHGPEDIPLSREEAVALSWEVKQLDAADYVLESAEVAVVLPNWFFTEYMDAHLQYSEVSRLGWVVKYTKPDSEFGEQYEFWFDYYTGQLLGGGMV